ncbi:MAG TPA: hypothetical protein VF290_08465 [Pyrinomonadaceae bacterium]
MKAAKNNIFFLAAADEKGRVAQTKAREIKDHLNKGTYRDEFDFFSSWNVGVRNLQETLLQFKSEHRPPYIVHFSAEATTDGNIALAHDDGRPHIVSGSAIVELFKLLKDGISAIILDGSHTQQLGRQLEGSIDSIVSMNGAIAGDSAVIFDSYFYQGLSYERDFKKAFNLGINQLELEAKNDDSSKPVLHERKVVVAAKPPLERKSVKYLDKNRRVVAASSV